jgi:hypothetical protein
MDVVSMVELRPRPPINLDEVVLRLNRLGPTALSGRERKRLLAAPQRLTEDQLDKILLAYPGLTQHAARTCFTYWPAYVREPWGQMYEAAVRRHAQRSRLQLLAGHNLSLSAVMSRSAPPGDAALAAVLPSANLAEAYESLRSHLGVRDSWLLSSSVLTEWLTARLRRKAFFEDPVKVMLQHERVRALLLPPPRRGSAGPAVRSTMTTQAQTVATILAAAFSTPPLLGLSTLASLTDLLLKSTFDDPRSALRSEGWAEVRRLYEPGFKRLLAMLCEQDLQVFFDHAMNEPDRREFWLQYLHEIERTGCVLDPESRKRLESKLGGVEELRGAIDRAHRFKGSSKVQAFYLVFSTLVVVEFSDTDNAAYVYSREYFEKQIEPRIRTRAVDESADYRGKPFSCT